MTESTNAFPARSAGRLLMLAGLGVRRPGTGRVCDPVLPPAPDAAVVYARCGAARHCLLVASLWRRRTVWRSPGAGRGRVSGGLRVHGLDTPCGCRRTRAPSRWVDRSQQFEARRADGTPFTQNDLIGDQHQALVFFRGTVVTDLHDRAGPARTTPRGFPEAKRPRDRGLHGRASTTPGRPRPTSRT